MLHLPITQRIIIGLALITTAGILVHDTKFDKAFALALPFAATVASLSHGADLSGNAHTHVERVSVSQLNSSMPRAQARDDHRRYLLPKHATRGFAVPQDHTLVLTPTFA